MKIIYILIRASERRDYYKNGTQIRTTEQYKQDDGTTKVIELLKSGNLEISTVIVV